MATKNTNSKKGFTIIEVVLVLAIAGLIFLMVFIAYPALRRSQADTERRTALSEALAQVSTYKTNNRKVPAAQADLTKLRDNYLGGTSKFVDPDGTAYTFVFSDGCHGVAAGTACTVTAGNKGVAANFAANAHKIYYYDYATCNGETVVASTGKYDVAITYRLENGVYCGTNSEK